MTDRDEDGFGSATPDEGINAGTDCNDTDPMLNREDADGDGFTSCESDCDDTSNQTFPGAAELESQSNLAYMADTDKDGYGDAYPLLDDVEAGSDCLDSDNKTFPGSAETDSLISCMTDADEDGYGDISPEENVTSGNDCDDEDAAMGQNDLDSDGFSTCDGDCNDTDNNTFPGSAEKEGLTSCMTDIDGDGYGATVPAAGATPGADCNDADPLTYYGLLLWTLPSYV